MKAIFAALIISISLYVNGNEIDYQQIKKQYPKAEYVVLDKEIHISYYLNQETGTLNAKSIHNITLLALKDNCEFLQNIQVPYNEFQNVNVLSAKFLRIDSVGEQRLAENIKVKFLKSKDYYISGILYHDLKVKEITPTVAVKEKMMVKYSYEYVYTDTRFLNSFHVQENEENVLSYKLTVTIPDYVKAELYPFHISDILNLKTKTENNCNILDYRTSNVKAKETHKHTPPASYFSPCFILTTKSFTLNGKTISILGSTGDLFSWYNALLQQLVPDKAGIKTLSAEIVKGKSTEEEKIEAIFKWVQTNIHYVAFEDGIAGFKPEEAQKVIETKYGDCKGMANALVELLSAAGINAHHTWIGTRHVNYPLSTNSLAVNNHMICTVFINNETYYLDPTDKGALWNRIPNHLQGKEALIGKNNSFEVKTIPINPIGNSICNIHFNANIADDFRKIFATMETTMQGEEALDLYNYYNFTNSLTKNKLTKNFLSLITTSFIADTSVKSMPVIIGADKISSKHTGEIQGAIAFDGTKIYLFLDQVPFLSDIPFQNIETPLYFDYKKKIIVSYTINFPSRLKVLSLPATKQIAATDNAISCKLNYTKGTNSITVSKEITIDTILLELTTGNNWEQTIEAIKKEENTPIILTL